MLLNVDEFDSQLEDKGREEFLFGLSEVSLGLLAKDPKDIDDLFGRWEVDLGLLCAGSRDFSHVHHRR